MRQRDNFNKDRQSDFAKVKRRVEEDHEWVNKQGEDNCNKEKEKTITARRSAVLLKRKSY